MKKLTIKQTMDTKELSKMIGTTGRWLVEGVEVDVNILNARSAYGRTDLKIGPVAGRASRWVSADRIIFEEGLE